MCCSGFAASLQRAIRADEASANEGEAQRRTYNHRGNEQQNDRRQFHVTVREPVRLTVRAYSFEEKKTEASRKPAAAPIARKMYALSIGFLSDSEFSWLDCDRFAKCNPTNRRTRRKRNTQL